MGRISGGIAIAAGLAGPCAAGPFDGLWRTNPTADCIYTGGDGGALKIEDDVLFGVESQCDMTDPVNVRDMDALLYDMQCKGEGTGWTDRAMFLSASDGGMYLIWNGYAFKYDRCRDDAAVGTVVTADQIGITDDIATPEDGTTPD